LRGLPGSTMRRRCGKARQGGGGKKKKNTLKKMKQKTVGGRGGKSFAEVSGERNSLADRERSDSFQNGQKARAADPSIEQGGGRGSDGRKDLETQT